MKAIGFLSLALLCSATVLAGNRIINGVVVPAEHFKEIVTAKADGSVCSATIVGERTVLTAAHCFRTGQNVKVEVGGQAYYGEAFRHPDYPNQDIDVGLVVLHRPVQGAEPLSVGGPVSVGESVFLLGYGCANPGGGGGNDGKLRMGESVVTDISRRDFVSRRPGGAALCFGDSGGPTLSKATGKYRVVGINSKGNILDTNYSLHLALPEVLSFLRDVSEKQNVEICGVTANCEQPTVGAPKFSKSAFTFNLPAESVLEQSLITFLEAPVKDLDWYLDPGAPAWIRVSRDALRIEVPKDAVGDYRASLTARNDEGADATLVHISISPPLPMPPTCTLTAQPSFIKLGETLTLALTTAGQVIDAQIDGKPTKATGGQLTLTPAASGVFVATGKVSGPGGTGTCSTRYGVK